MKRDDDLIRRILLEVEKSIDEGSPPLMEIQGVSKEEFSGHTRLLVDAGFVEASVYEVLSGPSPFAIKRLTWRGHEFLDSTRSPDIWNKTKKGAEKIGGLGLDLMLDLSKAYAKDLIAEKLGIQL
ncbi:DUF2513 domain-containing protein [Woodsholea maritima]|uniref:DUF2513 domain-containing protein n=1 Tax=Woodsholea maritima TaxID=240237 RepID=UPI0004780D9D|nr:DUF2513 domain-containing protein [Woodsholea maritima]